MKEEILKLRAEGKSYQQIANQLSCSKSIISYYCNPQTKIKTLERTKIRRASSSLVNKFENYRKRKNLTAKSRDFQRSRANGKIGKSNILFSIEDVVQKLGLSPICYLTGESIDLNSPHTYCFDHIVPVSKGGENSLDNLGLLKSQVNKAKNDLTVLEFIDLCKKILEYQGYSVKLADS